MDLKYGTENRNFLPSQPYYSMFPDVLESNQAEDFHDLIPQPEVCEDSLERQLINLEDTQSQFFNEYGSSTQHTESPLCATRAANLGDTNGDKTAFRFIGPLQENDYSVWDYPDTYSLSNQMDSLGTMLSENDHSESQTLDIPVAIQETQNIEDILYKKNESVYNNSMLDTVTFQDNSFISSTGQNFTQDIGLSRNPLEFPTFDDLNIDNPLTESLEELLFGEEHVLSLSNINERTAMFQSNSLENVNDNLGTYQNNTYNVPFPFSKPSTQNNENSFKKSNKSSLTNMENYISQTVSDLYVESQTVCQPIDNNNVLVESRTIEDLVNEAICNVDNNNENDTLQQVSNIEKQVQKPGFNKSFSQVNEDTCNYKNSENYKDLMQIRNNITEVESLLSSSSSKGSVDKFAKLHLPAETNSETCCNNELSTPTCQNVKITVPYDDSDSCKEKMIINKENHYNSGADNQLSIDKYLCIKPSKEKIIKDMNSRKGTSILLDAVNRKTLTVHDKTISGHEKHNLGKTVTGTDNKKTAVQNNTLQGTVVIGQEQLLEYLHVNKRQSNSNSEDGKINLQPKVRYQTDQINVNVNKSLGIQCEERNIKENVTTEDISNRKSSSSFDLKVQELYRKDVLQKFTPSVSSSGPSESTVAVKQRCSQCGIFLTASELSDHVCDNDSNNSHMCGLCNEILIGDYSVFTHLLSHKEETIYECDYCGKPFCDFNSLSDHILKHADTGIYSCDFCTTKYIQNSDISTHLLTHRIEPSYKCDTCEKYFSLQSVFLEHQQIHQQFLCHICGTFVVGKRILFSHLKYHEKQTSLQHIDKDVDSNASKKWNLDYNLLKQYIGFENDAETKPYLCDICGKQFLGQSSFLRHLCTHNDVFIDTFSSTFHNKSRSQNYQKFVSVKLSTPSNHVAVQNINSQRSIKNSCYICNKSFKTPNSLKRHVCVYKDQKNFVCEICDKSFTRSDQLSVHSVVHTGEKRHVCHVCQKSYTQRPALTYHLKSHGTFNKFECKMCRRFFPNKIKLDYHMSSHTGKQPYKCKVCGKSFAWLSSCYTHQGTHSDTNVYSCELCNKIFKTKQNLVAHMSKTYLHCSPKES